ncbi:hypothetical protein LPJ72_005647 [Coemansia sp. Benny D160-2]|nr:hypothetical protein LPJ72_005647 [Coemansia sp. Benny D160-2]
MATAATAATAATQEMEYVSMEEMESSTVGSGSPPASPETERLLRRHRRASRSSLGRRNMHQLSVDTKFVVAFMDFESTDGRILSVRKGDIIRVWRNGEVHSRWWLGSVIKSFYGNKGNGYFFPVLVEDYNFMDNRIASRIPVACMEMKRKARQQAAKKQ